MTSPSPAHELPPPVQMLQMIIVGRQISHALGVAARLDLATHLGGDRKTVAELARITDSNQDALYRMMRALASVGVFSEDEQGAFRNTPLSDTLRADVPASARPLALFFGHDVHIQAYLGLDHSVKTGRGGFEHIHGASPFDYAASHPEVGAVFNDAMTAFSAATGPVIAEAYDFGRFDKLVDIGGGHGQLLCTILARHPGLTGVLFDLPHVVAGARPLIEAAGVMPRVEVIGGDFFASVPESGAYLLKSILHDWSDADALRILQSLHRAASPGAHLVVAEAVLRPGNDADIAKFMDIEMLVTSGGGRERNATEWAELFAAGGFRIERTIPTPAGVSLIEAVRV
jgi:hypothetical protein